MFSDMWISIYSRTGQLFHLNKQEVDELHERRRIELLYIEAVYDDDWTQPDSSMGNPYYGLVLRCSENSSKTMHLKLLIPENYPLSEKPNVYLNAPWIPKEHLVRIENDLSKFIVSDHDDSLLTRLFEFAQIKMDEEYILLQNSVCQDISTPILNGVDECDGAKEKFEIIQAESLLDRNSVFTGLLVKIIDVEQVPQVLLQLQNHKRVREATHNVWAYRIVKNGKEYSDYDDDGETQAGSRLLHLLQARGSENVIVIVPRRYGGIHLGADRFRRFQEAAQQVLNIAKSDVKKSSKKISPHK